MIVWRLSLNNFFNGGLNIWKIWSFFFLNHYFRVFLEIPLQLKVSHQHQRLFPIIIVLSVQITSMNYVNPSNNKRKVLWTTPVAHVHSSKYTWICPMVTNIPWPNQTSHCYLSSWFVGLKGPSLLDLILTYGIKEIVTFEGLSTFWIKR